MADFVNRLGDVMKENKKLYLMRVDQVCKKCKHRNKGEYSLDSDVDIICCGNCGAFLYTPKDLQDSDKEVIEMCVKEALKGEKEKEEK
jgi:NMD protein affecting ribosome stability and mRNA decay